MNNKTDINEKWRKMSQKTKGRYMFVKVPLQRIIPLITVLILVNEIIMRNSFKDIESVMGFTIIKLIFSYILGVVIGHLEWNFFKNLSGHIYKTQNEIRNQYLLIYGLLFFGFSLMISEITYPFNISVYAIVQLILWPIGGLMWGIMMWFALGNGLSRYAKKEN